MSQGVIGVKRKNPNFLKIAEQNLRDAAGLELAIGYPKGAKSANPWYPDGKSILEVAIRNNFGIGYDERRNPPVPIPRRAFMDQSTPKVRDAGKTFFAGLAQEMTAGRARVEKVLDAFGFQAENIIREEITSGGWIPNSEFTIYMKKSDQPLIDTGAMRKYVSHIVRKKTS